MALRKPTLLFLISLFVLLFISPLLAQNDTLAINIQKKTGVPGGNVCIDVTAEKFTRVESLQFNLSYDATLISPQCPATNIHPVIKDNIFGDIFNCNTKGNGYLNFVWAAEAMSIPDGQVLFTLCFDIIGNPGNVSPISINGNLIVLEVCQEVNGKTICKNVIKTTPGSIEIKSSTLQIITQKCDADGVNNIENGSLTLYGAGGQPPYTYTVNGGEFTGSLTQEGQRVTFKNIAQKTYNIVITDALGSTSNKSVVISNNLPLSFNITKKDPTCADRSNGTIKLTNIQGFAPLTYRWSNLVSGLDSLRDISVGKYYVTVSDFVGCEKIDSIELSRSPLNLEVKVTKDAACMQPSSLGNIEIKSSGGSPWTTGDPYRLIINEGLNFRYKPPYLFSIRAGDFTLRISDSLGCSTPVQTFNMPFGYTPDMVGAINDVTCKGDQNGNATITVSPYSKDYSFFPLPGFPDILGYAPKTDTLRFTGLAPGNYAYRVLDINNCRDTLFFTIKEPDLLKINPTVVQPICSSFGSISLNPSGGTAGYTYTWNPSQTGNINTLNDITGGTFGVTVTDANQCKDSVQVTLNQLGDLSITPRILNNIICNGANNGSLIVDIVSANGPFNIIWADSSGTIIANQQTIQNVKPGLYTVQVMDNKMCSSFKTPITISEPPAFSFNTNKTMAPCYDQNGTASVHVIGGNSGYLFEWKNLSNNTVVSTDSILDAKAGEYLLSVINSANCTKNDTITIAQPDSIRIIPTITQPICDSLGKIILSPMGGGGNFTYLWSDGSTLDSISELFPGSYSVTVVDVNFCSNTSVFSINNSDKPIVTPDFKNITCSGANDGFIVANIQGPNNPFSIVWKNDAGTIIGVTDTIKNIGQGTYSVQVVDSTNCASEIKTISVTGPAPVAYTSLLNNALCFDSMGRIELISIIDTIPLIYQWQKSGSSTIIDRDSILQAKMGTYYVTVSNSGGCFKIDTFTISEPVKITFPEPLTRDVSCFGGTNGQSVIFSAGLSFTWSTGSVGPFALNLPAGPAWVIANDANNCKSDTVFVLINGPNPISLDLSKSVIKNPTCFGQSNGSATIQAKGGTGSIYSYSWQNGTVNPSNTNLVAGKYIVTITDSLSCTLIDSIVLGQPSEMIVQKNLSISSKPDCNNSTGGTIGLLVTGGNVGTKNINWQSGVNTLNGVATSLSAGTYCATITDTLGCSVIFCDTLTQDLVSISTTPSISKVISCNGLNDGILTVAVSGNSVPFNVSWASANGTSLGNSLSLNNIGAGKYYMTVTEQNAAACRKVDSIMIEQPNKVIFANPSTSKVTCFGFSTGQATIIGSPPGISYQWSSGASGLFPSNFTAGNHWVVGTNATGCKSDTVFFIIDTNPLLTVDNSKKTIVNPTCFGSLNGTATIGAMGGTGIGFAYAWQNGTTGTAINNIGAGMYKVTINDSNNCQHIDSVSLSQPAELVASFDDSKSVLLNCNSLNAGKIGIKTTGGNPGVKSIMWQSGLTVENGVATGLSAGFYCATVSDNFGCRDTFCYNLENGKSLRGEINNPAPPLCNGGTTCISVKSVTGGIGNKYTLQINNGIRYPIDSCVMVSAGQYFVSMIDSSGCSVDTLITINQPEAIDVDLGLDIEMQLGQSPSSINVNIDSPQAIDSIVWKPNEGIRCTTSECLSLLVNPSQTTTYIVSVTDVNGCKGSDELTVTVKNIRNVYFPNIFSPNRDGVNDYFQAVLGPGVEKILSFVIYDRWGGKVFEKSDFVPDPAGTDGWDGTYNGRRLDPGVFVYYVRAVFIDGKTVDYKGSVTLADKVRN